MDGMNSGTRTSALQLDSNRFLDHSMLQAMATSPAPRSAMALSHTHEPRFDEPNAQTSSSIERELARLRGDLFDISDADSNLREVLTKVQQLTEFENRVVEEQRREICHLREELHILQTKEAEMADGAANNHAGIDSLESIPSFGSSMESSSNASSSGFTDESERPSSYSLHANQQLAEKANLSQSLAAIQCDIAGATAELHQLNTSKDAAMEELCALNSTKSRIEGEVTNLRQQVKLLLEERTRLIQEVEIHAHRSDLADELEAAHEVNAELQRELEMLRKGGERADECITQAVQERRAATKSKEKLAEEVETLREMAEQAERAAAQVKEQAVRQWEKAVQEKELAEERLAAEALVRKEAQDEAAKESMVRHEMQKEMQSLYEEKIACEKELADARVRAKLINNASCENLAGATSASAHDTDIKHLKRKIQALRGENASLRSTAKRDSEMIAGLNDEIRSLLSVAEAPNPSTPVACAAPANVNATPVTGNTVSLAASRKRALMLSQGSVGEDERSREYKRSIHYEPHRERFNSAGSGSLEKTSTNCEPQRERFDSSGSGSGSGSGDRDRLDTLGSDTISALHEADNVSLLFGQESISGKSSKSNKSNGDEKSDHDGIRAHAEKLLYWANKASERSKKSDASVASQQNRQGDTIVAGRYPSPSPIPKTIGLPPRSQSRVRTSGLLPPRCPPSVSVVSSSQEVSDSSSTILSDKENGGSYFNREVPGAFPIAPRRKKNVSLSENNTIIHKLDNLDYVDDDPGICCECSISPFSGNDPQSEFYLPKLGLACKCRGSSIDDRASFSKNPNALYNILRPWQCGFLSTLNITTAEGLLKAHKADANGMSRSMKKWRAAHGMALCRSKECYVALKVWSRTCKVVLRSIREQKEIAMWNAENGGEEDVVIEKPHFLDITLTDTHTIASISTLGQFSSVGGGGRPLEMMEI